MLNSQSAARIETRNMSCDSLRASSSTAPTRYVLTQTIGGQISPFPGHLNDVFPKTFLTIVPLEADFVAVRVAYANCFGFSVKISSVSVYPSESYGIAPETDRNGGQAVAVKPIQTAGSFCAGHPVYFRNEGSSADFPIRSLELPADPQNPNNLFKPHTYRWSEWTDCRSVRRSDGGLQPLLFIYTTIGSADAAFVPSQLSALNTGGYARERYHYGLAAYSVGADFSDDPTGTLYCGSPAGFGTWNPVVAVQYRTVSAGIQVVAVGDSLSRAPTNDGVSNAVWRACADLSTPQRPIALVNMALGGGNPSLYNPLTALNAPIIQPSIAVLQVITRNGYAGLKDMRHLLRQMLQLGSELAMAHETRIVLNLPGGEPSWDAVPTWTDGFVSMRETLIGLSSVMRIPLIDATTVIAPDGRSWCYKPGMSDDGGHLNTYGVEMVVTASRLAIERALESELVMDFTEMPNDFDTSDQGIALVEAAIAHGNIDRGLQLLQKIADRFPNDIKARIRAVRLLVDANRLDEAEQWVRLDSEAVSAELQECAAQIAEMRRDWSEARVRWLALKASSPDSLQAYRGIATACQQIGDIYEAERVLHEAALRFPLEIMVRHDMARLAERQRHWITAEGYWRTIIAINPDAWWANAGIVNSLRNQVRFDEAEALLLKSQAENPTQLAFFIDHARLAEDIKALDKAVQRWQLVHDRFPDAWHGYVGLANALREFGKLEDAVALLKAARDKFPNEPVILHDLGRISERVSDWAKAEDYWRALLQMDSESIQARLGLASAMRQQGQLAQAETILSQAQSDRPDEPAYFIEFARLSDLQRKWAESEQRWRLVTSRFPKVMQGFIGLASALSEQARPGDAEEVLRSAAEAFPDQIDPCHHLAIQAGRAGDWQAAELWWRKAKDRFPDSWRSYFGLSQALQHLGRIDEARDLLLNAQQRFPNEPEIFRELPWLEVRCLNWSRAEEAFRSFCERFPTYAGAYIVGSEILQRQFRFDEAKALLKSGIEQADPALPVMIALAQFYARDDVGDRASALQCLAEARMRFPDDKLGYIVGIRHLRHAGRLEEAASLAAQAAKRWPRDFALAQEYAKATLNDDAAKQRVAWFRSVLSDYPEASAGYVGLALSLDRLAFSAEAETVMNAATERFPNDFEVAIEAATFTERDGKWADAVRRWSSLEERFPGDKRVSDRLFVARLRLAESGQADPEARVQRTLESQNLSWRDICMAFESMGGTGGGCEFGLFQRDHGAEPLGLLRWTTITPESLIGALSSQFHGVGLPENTILLPEENADDRREYVTLDRNFGLRMHTFVYTDEADRNRFYDQICRRLQYLRRKLVDDLAEGAKIFVYKIVERELEDEELGRIHQEMRRYGDNWLLYVRYADSAHPDGTVVVVSPGLMVGYIDHFQQSRRGESGPVVTHSWRAICRAAYDLWISSRS